jgi:tetratricopeptide (TPR) repeat protein
VEADSLPPESDPQPMPAVRRKVSVTLPNPIRPAVHEEPVFTDVAAPLEAVLPPEIVSTIVARIEVTDPINTADHDQPPITSTRHSPPATRHPNAASQAVAALEQGQPAQAAEIARSALREHADSAALCRILGVAEYRRGRYAAAQSAFQQALSLDNTNGLSYFLMGCTLARLGQQAAADRHLAKARVLDPRF